MIFCGMMAENPIQTTVLRALTGLFSGYVLGVLTGWVGMSVVRENAGAVDGDAPATSEEVEPSRTRSEQPRTRAASQT